ncbi:Holliday junction branch migration protein RuvA [Candidatus Woesebacteria bacterium]|nr:Holliday junction branch migration protein RuvA [Candidatus Woesebacteria bacterium]
MIAFLSGKPIRDGSTLLVLVNGVGYAVHVGAQLFATAPQQESIELYIYTHVREEALELYGFANQMDKNLFLLLLSVSGIGPKTALQIADHGAAQITAAVQNANVSFFTSIPRVGKKMGQKIIIDLKSKLGSLKELKIGGFSEHEQLIVDAVVALGFEEQRVMEALEGESVGELSVEAAIKRVLKKLQ